MFVHRSTAKARVRGNNLATWVFHLPGRSPPRATCRSVQAPSPSPDGDCIVQVHGGLPHPLASIGRPNGRIQPLKSRGPIGYLT